MTLCRFTAGVSAIATVLAAAPAYSVNVAAQQGTYAAPLKNNPQSCVSQSADQSKELFVNRNRQLSVNNSDADIWSGTRQELEAVVRNLADDKNPNGYAHENKTHLGRNATMLVPATLSEMEWEINFAGNPNRWKEDKLNGYHHPIATAECDLLSAAVLSFLATIKKYTNRSDCEVVYDKKTGKIVTDFHLGTKNYGVNKITHYILDVSPHNRSADYKYVGILYVHVTSGMYRIVDGQSGKYMSCRQVAEFPTTMSDMWKDRGRACVASDMLDLSNVVYYFMSRAKKKIEYMQGLVKKKARAVEADIKILNAITKEIADMALVIDKSLDELGVKENFKKDVWKTILAPLEKTVGESNRLQNTLGLPGVPMLPSSAGIIKYSENFR